MTREHLLALPKGCLVVLVTGAQICDMPTLRERVLADELSLAADVWDVGATEMVFVNIFDLAERQSEGIGVIIEQVRQQWESSRTLASLMAEISTSTQESTETIRAIATTTSQAARRASQLDQSVGRFRLREGEAAISSPLIPS